MGGQGGGEQRGRGRGRRGGIEAILNCNLTYVHTFILHSFNEYYSIFLLIKY